MNTSAAIHAVPRPLDTSLSNLSSLLRSVGVRPLVDPLPTISGALANAEMAEAAGDPIMADCWLDIAAILETKRAARP